MEKVVKLNGVKMKNLAQVAKILQLDYQKLYYEWKKSLNTKNFTKEVDGNVIHIRVKTSKKI